MTQEQKDLLLKDLCARLPYGVKIDNMGEPSILVSINNNYNYNTIVETTEVDEYNLPRLDVLEIEDVKPYLFPLSSMIDEDHAIYSKIWEDTGKMAYSEGCHHLMCTIKAYKDANDYLLSKHYDINGLIPQGLATDATGLNIY